MNSIIPGSNMKVLHKAILSLSRVSDEIYMECHPDSLYFLATNSNRTIYAKFIFHSVFFLSYEIESNTTQPDTVSPPVTAKLQSKSLLNVFKPKMEKKLEICKVDLAQDAKNIVFHLRYKHDVVMVHNLHLIDSDYLTINYNMDDCKNRMTGNGQFFTQVFSNFQSTNTDLSVEVTNTKTILKNYDIGTKTNYKEIRSQVALTSDEFILYSIGEEVSLVMWLKPLRSAVQFAEQFALNISLYFNSGGSPVIVEMKNPTFECNYVLSTVSPDGATQSSGLPSMEEPVLKLAGQPVERISEDDVAAMESVNWDNDFETVKRPRCSFSDVLGALQKENMAEDVEMVTESPTPVSKMAHIFARCFEPTMHASMIDFGEVLCPNSDSDSDT